MLSHFHLIPERHGQTDGQTNRIAMSILRVSVLMRDKNLDSRRILVNYSVQYSYTTQR